MLHPAKTKNTSSFTNLPGWLLLSRDDTFLLLRDGYFMKADILHDRPHNGQTTHLGREGINLIGPLADIAEQALDRMSGLNVAMHRRGKGIKGQQMLFIFG
jgi:hypothetical protein